MYRIETEESGTQVEFRLVLSRLGRIGISLFHLGATSMPFLLFWRSCAGAAPYIASGFLYSFIVNIPIFVSWALFKWFLTIDFGEQCIRLRKALWMPDRRIHFRDMSRVILDRQVLASRITWILRDGKKRRAGVSRILVRAVPVNIFEERIAEIMTELARSHGFEFRVESSRGDLRLWARRVGIACALGVPALCASFIAYPYFKLWRQYPYVFTRPVPISLHTPATTSSEVVRLGAYSFRFSTRTYPHERYHPTHTGCYDFADDPKAPIACLSNLPDIKDIQDTFKESGETFRKRFTIFWNPFGIENCYEFYCEYYNARFGIFWLGVKSGARPWVAFDGMESPFLHFETERSVGFAEKRGHEGDVQFGARIFDKGDLNGGVEINFYHFNEKNVLTEIASLATSMVRAGDRRKLQNPIP